MTRTNFENDVFISYSHRDNSTIDEGEEGWVDKFHRVLDKFLAQVLGRDPKIWRDPKVKDHWDDDIFYELVQAAVLVSILSPSYIRSEWCIWEGVKFVRAATRNIGLYIDRDCRIKRVVGFPLLIGERIDKKLESLDGLDEELKSMGKEFFDEIKKLKSHDFFKVDAKTGRPRDIIDISQTNVECREKMLDIAYGIHRVLESIEHPSPPDSGITVYLAETTSDLSAERDQIQRELETRDCNVLPDEQFPLHGPELVKLVRENLQRCTLSIHLIGAHYGMVPEAEGRSIVELQNALSVERRQRDTNFSRLIWLPDDLIAQDERQEEFVKNLRGNPGLQQGDDLLETPLEDFKTAIKVKLKASESKKESDDELTRIYLIYDQRDIDDIAPLEDYLYDQQFEVLLPLFDGDEAEVSEEHQENLRICDAVLIYYGHANEAWLRVKLRDLRKARGYGRSTPIQVKAIYMARPKNPRKARLGRNRPREVDEFIQNFGDFSSDDLRLFIRKLAEQKGGQR